MRLIAIFIRWIFYALALLIVFFNFRLYWPSPLSTERNTLPRHLVAQLAASREAFEGDKPYEMQNLFPEGYFFCYAFYGLTWAEAAMRDESLSSKAIPEIRWALDKIESADGKAAFTDDLPPDHGMFYSAWKCHLRAGLVMVEKAKDPAELSRLRSECDAIVESISNADSPFLASYEGSVWPCDTVPAIHALTTYDHITGESRYQSFIENWVGDARSRVDAKTGLLPHMATVAHGDVRQGSRATSQVICLRMLPDIDEEFAREQYEAFRWHFQKPFLSMPSLLEYPAETPDEIAGQGDVDSGPLIFGRSLSATVMMIGVAQIYGDQATADAIAQAGEVVGLPWTSNGKKNYAAGILPIGDIMVSYSQNAIRWQNQTDHLPTLIQAPSWYWRWPVHLISLGMLVAGWYLVKKRPAKSQSVGERAPHKSTPLRAAPVKA